MNGKILACCVEAGASYSPLCGWKDAVWSPLVLCSHQTLQFDRLFSDLPPMKGQAQPHIYLQWAALPALPCHGHGSSAAVRSLWMGRVGGISSHYLNTQMFDLSVGIQLDTCNWMTENNILEIFMLCALPLSCISPCVQKSLLLNIVYLSTWGGMTWPFPTSAWDLLLFLVISSR